MCEKTINVIISLMVYGFAVMFIGFGLYGVYVRWDQIMINLGL